MVQLHQILNNQLGNCTSLPKTNRIILRNMIYELSGHLSA